MDKVAEPNLQPEWLSRSSSGSATQNKSVMSGTTPDRRFPPKRTSTLPTDLPTTSSLSSLSAFPYNRDSTGGIRNRTPFDRPRSLTEPQPSPVSSVSPWVVPPQNHFDKNFPALGNSSPWKELVSQDTCKQPLDRQATVWSGRALPSNMPDQPLPYNGTLFSRPSTTTLSPSTLSPSVGNLLSKSLLSQHPSGIGGPLSRSISTPAIGNTTTSPVLLSSPPPSPPPPPPPPLSSPAATPATTTTTPPPHSMQQPAFAKALAESVQRDIFQKLIPKTVSWTIGAKALNIPSGRPPPATSRVGTSPSPSHLPGSMSATANLRSPVPSGLTVISKPKTKDGEPLLHRPAFRVMPPLDETMVAPSITSRHHTSTFSSSHPPPPPSRSTSSISNGSKDSSSKTSTETQKEGKMKWLQQLRDKDRDEERDKSKSPESDTSSFEVDLSSSPSSPDADQLITSKATTTTTSSSVHSTHLNGHCASCCDRSSKGRAPLQRGGGGGGREKLSVKTNGQLCVEEDEGSETEDEILPPDAAELDMLMKLGWNPNETPLTEEEKMEWMTDNAELVAKSKPALKAQLLCSPPLRKPTANGHHQSNHTSSKLSLANGYGHNYVTTPSSSSSSYSSASKPSENGYIYSYISQKGITGSVD